MFIILLLILLAVCGVISYRYLNSKKTKTKATDYIVLAISALLIIGISIMFYFMTQI